MNCRSDYIFYILINYTHCYILSLFTLLIVYITHINKIKKISELKINKYENINFNIYNQYTNENNILKCKYSNSNSNYKYTSIIPVLILNKDRLYSLKILLNKLLILKKHYRIDIYILDHFTTYKPTLIYIKKMVKLNKIKFLPLKTQNWHKMIKTELPLLIKNITINNLYYILTDSDICLNYLPNDVMNFYMYILDYCRGVDVVGPSIVVSNLPYYYPLSNYFFKYENKYVSKTHYDILWKNNYYSLVASPIDTTFQVRRSKDIFKRLKGKMFRSLPPYAVLHTDWYINPSNIPNSYLHYLKSSGKINHSKWNISIV